MRELIEITAAFEALCRDGKPAALATVVATEGSSYRRPGARMLIAEDGQTWGGVSGGCLERDVVRRTIGAMASRRSIVARYDTADDEQLAGGTATGCGGTVEVLIQPLSKDYPGPMPYLADVQTSRKPVELITVVHTAGELAAWAGRSASLNTLRRADCDWPTELKDAANFATVADELNRPRPSRQHARFTLLRETIQPPLELTLFGAGPDVVPVVAIAKTLGWRVTVVGSHPATHLAERFRAADVLHVTDSTDPTTGVAISPNAAVVIMTHNVARDARILLGLRVQPRYLGILGPRHRTDRILQTLPAVDPGEAIFSPVGLDLGAETPEEIALSIVAEIQKALRSATGRSLCEQSLPIHRRPATVVEDLPCPV